jgi:hypothetical protein
MPVEEAAPSPPTRSVACQTTRIQAAPKRAPPSSSDDTEEAAPSPPTRSVACQTTRVQAASKRAPPSSSDDTEDESDEELVRRPRARHRSRLVTRLCRNGCICAVARNPRPFVRFAVEISVCVAIILYVADGLIQKHYR